MFCGKIFASIFHDVTGDRPHSFLQLKHTFGSVRKLPITKTRKKCFNLVYGARPWSLPLWMLRLTLTSQFPPNLLLFGLVIGLWHDYTVPGQAQTFHHLAGKDDRSILPTYLHPLPVAKSYWSKLAHVVGIKLVWWTCAFWVARPRTNDSRVRLS